MPLEIPPEIQAELDQLHLRIASLEQSEAQLRRISERNSVEEALRESQELFKAIIENLGEGVCLVDPEERFIFTNPMVDQIFGVRHGKLLGRSLQEFTSPQQFDLLKRQTLSRQQGEKGCYDLEIIRPNGEVRQVSVTATPQIKAGKFSSAYGILRDITQARLTERALLESEERYRRIFETAGVSIWEEDFSAVKDLLDDLKTAGVTDFRRYFEEHPEFFQQAAQAIRVVDINSTTIEMFGAKSKEDFLGSIQKIFVPETLEILREEILAIAEGRTYFEGETINLTFSGEKIHVWIAMTLPSQPDKLNSVLVSLINISDRKLAEQESSLQRARFQQLFENAPIGIALLNTNDVVEQVNPAFESIFQFSAAELIGKSLQAAIVPADCHDEGENLFFNAMDGTTTTLETIRKRKDGVIIPVHVNGIPIRVGVKPVAVYIMYENISDRKHREQKLEYMSTHDPLTSLYNRAYFEMEINRLELENHQPVSIMVADVDDLKKVNDALGHAAGDALLVNTASVIKSAFRAQDIVARIGGDEFAVLLPDIDAAAADECLVRLNSMLADHNAHHPANIIGLSTGVATSNQVQALLHILQEADHRMYLDKTSKKIPDHPTTAG